MIFVDKSSQKCDWLWSKKHGIWLLFPISGETIKLKHKKTIKTWIFWNFKRENEVCLIVGVIVVSTWISLHYSWLFVSNGSNKLESLSPELPPHVLYILNNLSRSDIFYCLAFSFLFQHCACSDSLLSFLLLQKRNFRWKPLYIRYMCCDFWTIYWDTEWSSLFCSIVC